MLAGLQSGQWGRKKAAATAISQICKTSGDALASHAPALLDALKKQVEFYFSKDNLATDAYLVSQMMMAVGSSEGEGRGLKVTRYFSHGEKSMNCNTEFTVTFRICV